MSRTDQSTDTSMEEILASIRRIISEEPVEEAAAPVRSRGWEDRASPASFVSDIAEALDQQSRGDRGPDDDILELKEELPLIAEPRRPTPHMRGVASEPATEPVRPTLRDQHRPAAATTAPAVAPARETEASRSVGAAQPGVRRQPMPMQPRPLAADAARPMPAPIPDVTGAAARLASEGRPIGRTATARSAAAETERSASAPARGLDSVAPARKVAAEPTPVAEDGGEPVAMRSRLPLVGHSIGLEPERAVSATPSVAVVSAPLPAEPETDDEPLVLASSVETIDDEAPLDLALPEEIPAAREEVVVAAAPGDVAADDLVDAADEPSDDVLYTAEAFDEADDDEPIALVMPMAEAVDATATLAAAEPKPADATSMSAVAPSTAEPAEIEDDRPGERARDGESLAVEMETAAMVDPSAADAIEAVAEDAGDDRLAVDAAAPTVGMTAATESDAASAPAVTAAAPASAGEAAAPAEADPAPTPSRVRPVVEAARPRIVAEELAPVAASTLPVETVAAASSSERSAEPAALAKAAAEPASPAEEPAPLAETPPVEASPVAIPAEPVASVAAGPMAAGRSLEDAMAALLKPMLREWLDDNMPRILEKVVVCEELARVGRKGE
ncbi:MAG: DUF2497 domain-containing protein [Hyphomicrobiaceae bacterium]